MAAFGESATSKSAFLSKCDQLIDAKDIDDAYNALCKEEV